MRKAIQYNSADQCREATIVALGLSPHDKDFLDRSMRTYAQLVIAEATKPWTEAVA